MVKEKESEYDYERADTETKYYDMLYDFAGVVTKANEQSFEGLEPKKIAGTLRRSVEAFCQLCMIDTMAEGKDKDVEQEKPKKQKEEAPSPVQEAVPDQETEERPLPDNFLRIDKKGWGLCPICHSRVLKVTATTRLENFPVFCKRCKADHLVNWWNADNQRILYKRYVNDRYLRDQALKGTGLHSFRSTGSSAPERVAMGRS